MVDINWKKSVCGSIREIVERTGVDRLDVLSYIVRLAEGGESTNEPELYTNEEWRKFNVDR